MGKWLSVITSTPKPLGTLLSNKSVNTFGIRTLIEYRAVGQSIQVYVRDQVPESLSRIDPDYVTEWVKAGGDIDKLAKVYAKLLKSLIDSNDVSVELVKGVITRFIEAYGPLTPLLMDNDLTDIYIDLEGIRVIHRDYGLCRVELGIGRVIRPLRLFPLKVMDREVSFREFINHLVANVARRTRTPVTAYMPLVSVTDGEFRARFTVSIEPVSNAAIHARLLPKVPWTLPALVNMEMISVRDAALLWALADAKVPILIVGPIGSGKTSLANAIAMMIRPTAFKVIVTDVDEMSLPGHLVVKLSERRSYGLGVKPITKDELIAHALRMGADYIIVNEVRESSEVKAWLNAVTTGHGGITTFHAEDYQQMIDRLSVLAPGSESVVKNMVVVVLGISYAPHDIGKGVRTIRKTRYVRDIVLPGIIRERYLGMRDELHIREGVITSLLNSTPEQVVSTLNKVYSGMAP